jgi:hypothetical protein
VGNRFPTDLSIDFEAKILVDPDLGYPWIDSCHALIAMHKLALSFVFVNVSLVKIEYFVVRCCDGDNISLGGGRMSLVTGGCFEDPIYVRYSS